MKTLKYNIKSILIILVLGSIFTSCQDEELTVPAASTQASFEYTYELLSDPETGNVFYEVTFINQSVKANGYLWDFGNGETSTEENPVYTYTENGIFDVTLTVTPGSEQVNLHYNNLTATQSLELVPTIFREGFDDPNLGENFPPEGWMLKDEDGDGNTWYWDEFEGEFYILSRSYDAVALTPDNWIITPQIDLSDISSGVSLQFDVAPTANTPQYRLENYSVLISTTGTETTDFTEIFTERLEAEMTNWVWMLRNINISDYAGENIYIAFRHHDSTDFDRIALTNIHVFQSGN
jgi:PKD repeat protein